MVGSGDDRLSRYCTIMGPAGLTAVFGMGTGGAPQVSSPGCPVGAVRHRRGVGRAGFGRVRSGGTQHGRSGSKRDGPRRRSRPGRSRVRAVGADRSGRWMRVRCFGAFVLVDHRGSCRARPGGGAAADRGGQACRLLGPVGCDGRPSCTPGLSTWWSSRSLHGPRTNGNLVLKRASRLDAFSAYPFPTWLPGDAPSGTAGTPEVGPPQSSRTRGDPSQVSHAHGR